MPKYTVDVISSLTGQPVKFNIHGIPYPSSGEWPVYHDIWNRVLDYTGTTPSHAMVNRIFPLAGNNAGLVTEHIFERQSFRDFVNSSITGGLPSGAVSTLPPMDYNFWTVTALQPIPNAVPIGVSRAVTPIRRLMTVLGARRFENVFVLAGKDLNGVKSRIWSHHESTSKSNMRRYMTHDIAKFIECIRNALGVFVYLNHPMVHFRLMNIMREIRDELQNAEGYQIYTHGPATSVYACARFDEWAADHFATLASETADWALNWIGKAVAEWNLHPNHPFHPWVMSTLFALAALAGGLQVNLDGIPGQWH
ncbi:hypothetical protein FPOAC1_000141 [Fusarium poae]|uniref:hypothetical protein n=1 Tax=Fusarium poae TaxID=36050 RepID=UPI001CE9306D|nr:hypothetical protein FPOAC1_000141 [Fusarium poae]KAG8674178.1 hypothetical protein FPOAC1_000141 [Fusarium poae]